MRLYVLRHGKAAKPDSLKYPDDDRPLVDEGRERIAKVAEEFAGAGIRIDRILASPYLRTQETAQIVAEHLGVAVETENLLALDSSVGALLEKLKETDGEAVLLVGHEPGLIDLLVRVSGKRHWSLKPGDWAQVELR